MSNNQISIKPNNHRVYQCPTEKKLELLKKIILEHEGQSILVACSKEPQTIIDALENPAIQVIEDKELIKDKELSCELLVSFDLPIKNIVYMARVVKATQKAVMILDEKEQKELHQIEMLLGRALKQEVIEGFEYQKVEKKEEPRGAKPLTKEQIKEVAKKRYDKKTQPPKEKSYEKKSYPKKPDSDNKWAKKKKAPNKFLGKDENGKAIFSGKSGERNHHYDGTPKVGKKINIKARKPKEEK